MTIFRFSLGLAALLCVAILAHWAWKVNQFGKGERAARTAAVECGAPVADVRYGSLNGTKMSDAIILSSRYAFCPDPKDDKAIQCVKDWGESNGYDVFTQPMLAGCERFGTVE